LRDRLAPTVLRRTLPSESQLLKSTSLLGMRCPALQSILSVIGILQQPRTFASFVCLAEVLILQGLEQGKRANGCLGKRPFCPRTLMGPLSRVVALFQRYLDWRKTF
jgi:hypothetical protein